MAWVPWRYRIKGYRTLLVRQRDAREESRRQKAQLYRVKEYKARMVRQREERKHLNAARVDMLVLSMRRSGLTLKDIGSYLGACSERVRHREHRALRRLRGRREPTQFDCGPEDVWLETEADRDATNSFDLERGCVSPGEPQYATILLGER